MTIYNHEKSNSLISFNVRRNNFIIPAVAAVSAGLLAFLHVSNAVAHSEPTTYPSIEHISGTNITGPNDLCGEIIYTFPQPFPNIRLAFMGELDLSPEAQDAIPLSYNNCNPDVILATTTDPNFLAFNQGEDADPSLKNLPIRDIPSYINRNGVRTHLARNGSSNNPLPARFVGNTEEDITLGKWLHAKGHMTIKCTSQQSAKITIRSKHLIENSLYTIWGWYKAVPPAVPEETFIVLPLGGVPNVVLTDKKGKGTSFKRNLSYCPLEQTEDGTELLAVVVTWHPDGAAYGAAPSVDFVKNTYQRKDGTTVESTFPAGIVGQDQIMFPVRLKLYQ